MKFTINIFLYFLSSILIIIFLIHNILHHANTNNIRSMQEKTESEIVHIIKFNFKTNHNPDEINNPISYLLLNDVRIPINVGTPSQTILTSLRFNDYLFFLSSPCITIPESQDKSNIFNNSTSSSYKFISHDMLFYKSILTNAERANETFYFQNDPKNNLILNNFTFYYSTKMSYNQSGGVVGLCLEDSNMNLHSGMNFFTQLKLKKAISYKTFFINYKDKDSGELIIGAYPHEYSKDEYKYENYKDIRGYTETTFVIYGIVFDEIIFGENNNLLLDKDTKRIMTAELRLEFGFIQAPNILEENITQEFINMDKCQSYKTKQQEIYGNKLIGVDEFIYYVCDKDYEVNKNLSFINKELGFNFELNKNDLFMEYGNKKYFNVVFNAGYYMKNWIFGKPLFLKYQWAFDPDKKRLGVYTVKENLDGDKDENNKNTTLIVILIISIFAFLVVLIIFLYQIFIKRSRKNRKNEILDEYDYNIN